MTRLLIVAALVAVIHMINTLIYAVRLSGVRTQRLATALSLFQVIFLLSSTANLIQAPLLSSIVEQAINQGLQHAVQAERIAEIVLSPFYQEQLALLSKDIRFVIGAASVGTLIGWVLIPPFVKFFTRAILIFDEVGSVPRVFLMVVFSPRRVREILQRRKPEVIPEQNENNFKFTSIPKGFLLFNIIITGFYTVGVLSSLYAGALYPQFRQTAGFLAGIINGVAAILMATIVDPTAARITDQALRGARAEKDVRQMTYYLAATRLVGTVFAQVILIPSAYVIKYVAQAIT
ncbi:lipid II flippase Amj family protein [Desulfolucanica intricata]|uniref:lipid II flippase Amj family protein n=1 Tax=Desulfolucanica intricata TaxID=1285191 RepID=UPI00082E2AEC|nr:lipid II flippase Amj family protein [Desulfolucanica intricata]